MIKNSNHLPANHSFFSLPRGGIVLGVGCGGGPRSFISVSVKEGLRRQCGGGEGIQTDPFQSLLDNRLTTEP